MTKNAKKVFLDTNIVIRANVAEAPFHSECLTAVQHLRAVGHELWLSRQVLREFAAVLTRPQGFVDPRPVATVVERVRYLQTHFYVTDEGLAVTDKLLELLLKIAGGGKQVHDTNIVASMLVYGITHLVTLNTADFNRFAPFITVWSLEDALREPKPEND
ncbi:MAG: type II toxin-antitoxin system VapC family toxin [Anaerolineae bacterium]